MACPICGERRPCPHVAGHTRSETSILVDPEHPDHSEERFAASLDASSPPSEQELQQPGFLGQGAIWRQEVASRVDAFCARRGRKRSPRTPSLSLDFERAARATAAAHYQTPDPWEGVQREPVAPEPAEVIEGTNIIEFPRPAPPPLPPPPLLPFIEELAEPIIETPRILEAEPEDIGLQFGGEPLPSITLDPPPTPARAESFPEAAGLSQRAFAGLVDGAVVLLGAGTFLMVVERIGGEIPHSRAALAVAVVVPGILWAIYVYLYLVYSGVTPGMRFGGIVLRTFDGGVVPQRLRRWRAIAMMVSAMSLGLGFLWAVIDDDGLCWHDRISRTLLRPRSQAS